jgi:NADP-dependent 3-hydroxy acid dehydrogenase YdfG
MTETMKENSSGCVLITGAGSGIGAATARNMATSGRAVVLTGRQSEPLDDVVATITKAGGHALSIPCDSRDQPQMQSAAQLAISKFGPIDIMVAAAGVMPVGPLCSADPEDWRQMLETNILGVLHAVHAVLPGMLEQGTGHIVLLGSVAGRTLFPDATVYCATKSAVHVIAEGLRSELVRRRRDDGNKIRVTLIAPGAVDTALPATIRDEQSRAATKAWYDTMDGILLPEDVAETIQWAVQAPEHVSVNEVVVRPSAMAR